MNKKKKSNKLGCYFLIDSIKVGFDLESIDILNLDAYSQIRIMYYVF